MLPVFCTHSGQIIQSLLTDWYYEIISHRDLALNVGSSTSIGHHSSSDDIIEYEATNGRPNMVLWKAVRNIVEAVLMVNEILKTFIPDTDLYFKALFLLFRRFITFRGRVPHPVDSVDQTSLSLSVSVQPGILGIPKCIRPSGLTSQIHPALQQIPAHSTLELCLWLVSSR